MKRNSQQQGVALVVTLILLSVITFMTVAFLVISRKEGERATTQTTQNTARYAADVATEQAKGLLAATMFANNNSYGIPLIVSTNLNSPGYISGNTSLTNVSYTYANGAWLSPLGGKDQLGMLNNLQILPRVPVFVQTNSNPSLPLDFRFYHDLNRNGVYDTNGIANFYDVNGNLVSTNHFFVGDPEWVGVLDKPEQRHSSSNQFIARYAFIILPIGDSLDINYIHNDAKHPPKLKTDGFLRDQGFGSWEINLAAFLYYLNTNTWVSAFNPYKYSYANANIYNGGVAFDDATGILLHRYNGSYNNLPSFFQMCWNNNQGPKMLPLDYIDEYLDTVPMLGTHLSADPDPLSLASKPWSGSDNPQHLFTIEDLYNIPDQYLNSFATHLYQTGLRTNSSYDRYTLYNLLSQMSFDSAPELPPERPGGKINLNYVNVGGTNATNFIAWTPLQFFTNAANKLLQNFTNNATYDLYNLGWPANNPNPAGFPTNFSVNYIPIYPTNFYTPAVHRQLQLAANIYDASNTNFFPSVFRPVFGSTIIGGITNIYIRGYVEEGSNTVSHLIQPLALPDDVGLIAANPASVTNIYGIPYVIGAKKGLPNFNELAVHTVPQITRKLQIDKHGPYDSPRSQWTTNQMYVVGVSNIVGMEAWNSYSNTFSRAVNITAADDLRMSFTVTNMTGGSYTTNLPPGFIMTRYTPGVGYQLTYPVAANAWTGFRNTQIPGFDMLSFQIPFTTNVVFVPDSAYFDNPPRLTSVLDPTTTAIPPTTDFRPPQFILGVTNRLRFALTDAATGRILDYVTFAINRSTNLSTALAAQSASLIDNTPDTGVYWNTNLAKANASPNSITEGIVYQIQGSLAPSQGAQFYIPLSLWNNAQLGSSTEKTKSDAITAFIQFCNKDPAITNRFMQVPFTPTRKLSDSWTWQANDPLVHYTVGDLGPTNYFSYYVPPNSVQTNYMLPNIGRVNLRYKPWGGNPSAPDPSTDLSLTIKDPGANNSDAWDFPTNKFPNIGWLGRVHRGTPWQTVYLKSPAIDAPTWRAWNGNNTVLWPPFTNAVNSLPDTALMQPTNDWSILDLFTVAQNPNASRGELSVNQTNYAAWAAILQGVIALTNSSSDSSLQTPYPIPQFNPVAIDPNMYFNNTNMLVYLVDRINARRYSIYTNIFGQVNYIYPGQVFQHLGDILSVPELTVNSPFLNTSSQTQLKSGLTDEAYERIPQQILSLLKVGEPRYVIFAYGQALKPAPRSMVTAAGQYFGMITNYQIVGEVATRSVVRMPVETRPRPGPLPPPLQSQMIMESFNVLPSE